MRIRLGTRGSVLATTQSRWVADRLRAAGHEVDIVVVRTQGDTDRSSLTEMGGIGVFAAELRRALRDAECDIAVHSMKDLPTAPVEGLVVGAVPEREDLRDVLCARDGLTLEDLPPASRVGSGSPRRVAQLRALRPDCEFVDIRGNIGTRLARVAPGDLDAVVLAAAGLSRVGELHRATEFLPILPAPGQGALAVECRQDDADVLEAIAILDHPPTREAVDAERAVLAGLGGGCAAPIAARAEVNQGRLQVTGGVFAGDGTSARVASRDTTAEAAEAAGKAVADQLLAEGAALITQLGASRDSRLDEFHDDRELWARKRLDGLTVLVPKEPGPIGRALQDAGAAVWWEPMLRRRNLPQDLDQLPVTDWVAVTSVRTVAALEDLGWRIPDSASIAAVGPATAQALRESGYRVDLVPSDGSSAEALLASWPTGTGSVLVPGSQLSRTTLVDGLRGRGWDASSLPLYTMEPVDVSGSLRVAWQRHQIDAVVVTAGSVARAIGQSLGWRDDLKVVAFGPPSATVLAGLGVRCTVAKEQNPEGVVEAMVQLCEEME